MLTSLLIVLASKEFPAICDLYWDQIILVASARSKGALLVSATDQMKKIKNIGNKGNMNHTALCDSILTVKLKLPVKKITINIAELKTNS